jgi:copper chaperone NosL
MMIIDNKYASEFMTSKGKSYKFDSIECMIDYIDNIDESEVSIFLVNDYGNPGRMINTNIAFFLISDNITSPMGANLSAFSDFNDIDKVDSQGDVYNWNELIAHVRKF